MGLVPGARNQIDGLPLFANFAQMIAYLHLDMERRAERRVRFFDITSG